ncbi:hypothetical protein QJS04_geneDACA003647 [Acorus gramineus]|uniref:Zinc finger protein 830 n=1 Tax=Acorus gramineus TaxID=55184 RepID=A0AAV9BMA9_ACOGR|nr:hypothetical protein QJS04_geneDACA003647 [Acorus gramineus]
MDAQARKKALFRAKLREAEQKREKRIESPLIRYENDQAICRVCNVTIKSESLWNAHQASRKHHEAIENLKAAAAGKSRPNDAKPATPVESIKPRPSSAMPSDFFDKPEPKRQKTGSAPGASTVAVSQQTSLAESASKSSPSGSKIAESTKIKTTETKDRNQSETNQLSTMNSSSAKQVKGVLPEGFFGDNEENESKDLSLPSQPSKKADASVAKQIKGALPEGFFDDKENSENRPSNPPPPSQQSRKVNGPDVKQPKGALPEGFFDNKDADMRARGIEPVKVDIMDEYKEFEKVIQEDLQQVDNRLEEEEVDAAEVLEEYETLEQRAYKERVEMLKKHLMEAKAAKVTKEEKRPHFKGQESSDESSSSDGDDDEDNFVVDWRAKHL